jgi:hypothetical protein
MIVVRQPFRRRTIVTQYFQLGIVLITIPNLIVIAVMLVVFAAGLLLKLPVHPQEPQN